MNTLEKKEYIRKHLNDLSDELIDSIYTQIFDTRQSPTKFTKILKRQ